MNKNARFYRMIVVQEEDGRCREWRVQQPLMRTVVRPVLMKGGFGQILYHWDGKETNVQGLPVYR